MIQQLTTEHRHCDELFAEVEAAVHCQNFESAKSLFANFQNEMFAHFDLKNNDSSPLLKPKRE